MEEEFNPIEQPICCNPACRAYKLTIISITPTPETYFLEFICSECFIMQSIELSKSFNVNITTTQQTKPKPKKKK